MAESVPLNVNVGDEVFDGFGGVDSNCVSGGVTSGCSSAPMSYPALYGRGSPSMSTNTLANTAPVSISAEPSGM